MVRAAAAAALWGLAQAAWACSVCFSESPFHLGLILGTFFLIPLPILLAWLLLRAAKKSEEESRHP